MRLKDAFVVVLVAAVAILVLQNTAPTSVRFLLWALEGVPLATVILLSVAIGIVIVGVPLWLSGLQLRRRVRALEQKVTTVAERPGEPRDSEARRPFCARISSLCSPILGGASRMPGRTPSKESGSPTCS